MMCHRMTMLLSSTVSRQLTICTNKTGRNPLSALCACHRHTLGSFDTSTSKPISNETFERRSFVRQNVSKAKSKPVRGNKYAAIQSLQSINVKKMFSVRDAPVDSPDITDEAATSKSEQDPDTVLPSHIADSIAMSAFQSRLSHDDDLVYSNDDWKSFEQEAVAENPALLKSWETLCMQLMFQHGCANLASSLVDYLTTDTSSAKISTLSLYIALQGKFGGQDKEQNIQEAYKSVLKISDVFDSLTAKYLISGLSCSSQLWRTTLDILEMVKLTTPPGPVYYSPIIVAALREGDRDLAFRLLDELALKGFEPHDKVLEAVLKLCESSGSHDLLERYFASVWRYNWILSQSMAEAVHLYFSSLSKEKWVCKWTTANTVRGTCHGCKHTLDRIELPASEFETLQRKFLDRTLLQSNVYLKSNPQEVERFQDFVMENAPFDVVLDALNVALKGSGRFGSGRSKQLREMVHYFVRKRHMRVLVIGRTHMKKWSAPDMTYISRHAKTFFTEDISSDDPFALYATLYSGKDCLFVSGDFLRNHKHDLGPGFREIFERWQKSRQIVNFTVSADGVSVKMPSQYDIGPVKDETGWHIPYNDGNTDLRSSHQAVLCLRHKGEHKTLQKSRRKNNAS